MSGPATILKLTRRHRTVARAIARIVGDTACGEELAMEAFWKFWQTPQVQDGNAGGWLYRTAINLGPYELRRRVRHARYRRLLHFRGPPTPKEIRRATEEREHVRRVLAAISPRDAELLLLRRDDFSYEELASVLSESRVGGDSDRARTAGISEGVHQTLWRTANGKLTRSKTIDGWTTDWTHSRPPVTGT